MTRVRFNSSCNYGFVLCLGFALLGTWPRALYCLAKVKNITSFHNKASFFHLEQQNGISTLSTGPREVQLT